MLVAVYSFGRGTDQPPDCSRLFRCTVYLPLHRLKELAEKGAIGSVAPRHFSFTGSITAPGRMIAETAPEVARMLLEDEVDAVLLTPV